MLIQKTLVSETSGGGHERISQGGAPTDTARGAGKAGNEGSSVGDDFLLQRSRRRGPLLAAPPEYGRRRSGENAPSSTRGRGSELGPAHPSPVRRPRRHRRDLRAINQLGQRWALRSSLG